MEKLDSSPESTPTESLVEMNRLNNLSDGLFAVALTLLAFDLRLPEDVPIPELSSKLLDLAPKFMVYLISFVVIGGAWGAHQRMFSQIKRGDGVLVWFNLFWVGLFILLFTTDWLAWQLSTRKQQTSFPLDDVKRASIHIHHEAGHLRIDSKAAENILLDGVFGGGLESHVDRSEDAANIKLKVPKRTGLLNWKYPWSWGSASALDWTLHFNDQIPLALEIETYAGELRLELGGLQVTDLKIKVKSSSTYISLPDREGYTTVTIDATTAKLTIRVPADVAVDIHNEFVIGTVEGDLVRFRMLEKERHYQSANYETATKRADIRVGGDQSSAEFV